VPSYDFRTAAQLPEVKFKAKTVAEVKKRVEAYRTLFEVEPVLRVSGTLKATDGETAWLNRNYGEPVVQLGAVVTLDLGAEGLMRFRVDENADAAQYLLSGR